MIVGIGTDIVEVDRIEREYHRLGADFSQSLFTSGEIAYCEGRRNRFESYAARFAAKEAFLKALGTGGRDGISWQDIEVIRDERGRPDFVLRGRAQELARERGVERMYVSLSHSRQLATAVAVLEANGN